MRTDDLYALAENLYPTIDRDLVSLFSNASGLGSGDQSLYDAVHGIKTHVSETTTSEVREFAPAR